MTGFGRGEAVSCTLRVLCEIKTVNSKFLDISVKLPSGFAFFESSVKGILAECGISRGKADIRLEYELEGVSGAEVVSDHALAVEYLNAMNALADSICDGTRFTLRDVIGKPDVLKVKDVKIDDSEFSSAADAALRAACRELLLMRENEGGRLKLDFENRLSKIDEVTNEINELSENGKKGYFEKLESRLKVILADGGITPDEQRILTECAIFADKAALDEETVRLKSHTDAFRSLFEDGEPVGRRLDFLTQEMNREANTIGSKCQDSKIAHRVVVLKNEIEKIREQVQNIE